MCAFDLGSAEHPAVGRHVFFIPHTIIILYGIDVFYVVHCSQIPNVELKILRTFHSFAESDPVRLNNITPVELAVWRENSELED